MNDLLNELEYSQFGFSLICLPKTAKIGVLYYFRDQWNPGWINTLLWLCLDFNNKKKKNLYFSKNYLYLLNNGDKSISFYLNAAKSQT